MTTKNFELLKKSAVTGIADDLSAQTQAQLDQWALDRSFTEIGDFTAGFTITGRQQIALFADEWYRWDGPLNKTVAPGSTPAGTGGVAPGAWRGVGDALLRQNLINGLAIVDGLQSKDLIPKLQDIPGMIALVPVSGKVVNVLNYRASIGGGGQFVYDGTKAKSLHDGEKVIDPTKAFPLSWADTAQRDAWFTPNSVGVGCWVKQYSADETIKGRGYEFDQETSYAESAGRLVFGEEYLQHVVNAGRSHLASPIKIIHSGDSTTAGAYGDADPILGGYTPSTVMTWLAESYGVRTINVNSGHSGEDTVAWNATRVSADIAAHADMDCYIVRWGINDGATHGSAVTFETNLRAGLQKLRTFKSLANLSIVLMAPNSVYDIPNNRDAKWFEKINTIIRQAARDFKCVFFDTYALYRDSKNAAGIYYDDPFADGRAIHPYAELTARIYTHIGRMIFDPIVAMRKNVNRISNVHSGELILSVSVTDPNAFPFGISIYRSTDFPFDGIVEVTKSADNVIHQLNISRANGRTAKRTYNPETAVWTAFSYELTPQDAAYTGQAGFDGSTAKIVTQGNIIASQGFISCASQVIAAGTHIATLSDTTKACSTDAVYFTATVWGGGTTWGSCLFQINGLSAGASAGRVLAVNATPFAVQRVYLNAAWSNF